jgi:hypothetical protein
MLSSRQKVSSSHACDFSHRLESRSDPLFFFSVAVIVKVELSHPEGQSRAQRSSTNGGILSLRQRTVSHRFLRVFEESLQGWSRSTNDSNLGLDGEPHPCFLRRPSHIVCAPIHIEDSYDAEDAANAEAMGLSVNCDAVVERVYRTRSQQQKLLPKRSSVVWEYSASRIPP